MVVMCVHMIWSAQIQVQQLKIFGKKYGAGWKKKSTSSFHGQMV